MIRTIHEGKQPDPTGAPVGPLTLTAGATALQTSPTLAIDELVSSRRASGRDVVHLGFGEASFPLHPMLRDALGAAATATAYGPVLGAPALRQAVASYLARERGLDASAERIAIGPGTKPLLYGLLHVLTGDLLLPRPSWVSYEPQAKLLGRHVTWVETDDSDHHQLTTRALEAARQRALAQSADPRILIVNSPSNPTGGVFTRETVEVLCAWARANAITVISDEIYAELTHGSRPHVSPARFYPEGTIVTGGLSKAFSAGGWRLGYALFPSGVSGSAALAALRALASEVWSSASTPVQLAALAAFGDHPEVRAHVRRSARLHGHAAGRLQRALTDLGILCAPPKGAFYLYPDLAPLAAPLSARGVTTSPELARYLLEEWGIATLPGTAFGDPPMALRLRLATSWFFSHGEAECWKLLQAADSLDEGDPAGGAALALPRLDQAIAAFGRFVTSLRQG